MKIIKRILEIIGKALILIITLPFLITMMIWVVLTALIGVVMGTHTLTFGNKEDKYE